MTLSTVVLCTGAAIALVGLVLMLLVLEEKLGEFWIIGAIAATLIGIGVGVFGASLRYEAEAAEFLASCDDQGGEPVVTGSEVRYLSAPNGTGGVVDVATRFYLYECRDGNDVVLTLDSTEKIDEAEQVPG